MHSIFHVLVIALVLILPAAQAAAGGDWLLMSDVSFSDIETEIGDANFDGEINLITVAPRLYLADSFYVDGSVSMGEGTISETDFEATVFSLGGGLAMLDRINFVTGSGHELRVGLRYETSEVTLGETQAEINPLFADIAYSVGLGHGLSGFTEVSADVENLADRFQIGLGLHKHVAKGLLVSVGYEREQSYYSDLHSSTVSGFYLGAGYAF